MLSTKNSNRYYKYHKKHNDKEKLFPDEMFHHAQIVLLRIDEDEYHDAEVFFVKDQNKEDDYQYVECWGLDSDFELPRQAKKISEKEFEKMAGEDW